MEATEVKNEVKGEIYVVKFFAGEKQFTGKYAKQESLEFFNSQVIPCSWCQLIGVVRIEYQRKTLKQARSIHTARRR
jgi:hypothetical protein